MAKRKKRNAITLVSLLLALAALIGVYVWYSNRPSDNDYSSAKKTQDISLAKVNTADVTQIHYTGGTDADIVLELKDGVWKSKENPDRPINQKNVSGMLSLMGEIKATQKIRDNPENLADYGLDTPYASIQLTLKDGKTVSMKLGDEALTGDGYYATVNDSSTVYLVTVNYGSGLNYSDIDFTEIESTPTITATNINYINVDNRDGQDVELKLNEKPPVDNAGSTMNKWQFLKPYGNGYSGDTTAITDFETNYASFELTSCVDYTGKDFAKYGLDDPTTTITVGYYENAAAPSPTSGADSSDELASAGNTTNEFKIYIGNKNEAGDYYVRLENSQMVYTMGASTVDKMLQVDTFSLLYKYLNIPNINSLDEITANIGDTEYKMTISQETGKNKDGKDETKYSFYYNSKKADEEAFKTLYQTIVTAKYDAEMTDKVDSTLKPVLTMSFHLTGDSESTVKTSFLPYNDSFYIADKGTGKYFLVDKRTIDDIAKAIETFNPEAAAK